MLGLLSNNSQEEAKHVEIGDDYEKNLQVPSDELSVGSGDPTIADSDTSDEEYMPPVWIPLKEEIDHTIELIEEKMSQMKSLEK